MTNEVNVILMDFKDTKTNEMVAVNEDGSYTIFINSRQSHNRQLEAYSHALKHIENNDFQKEDVQSIEHFAHSDSQEKVVIPANEFVARIKSLQRRQQRLKREIKEYEKDLQFLIDNCDMFARAENRWLYDIN